ncbi:diacylglycerol O-acyltransferase 2-like isoform X1 [Episyrphus balteatus]|uniref:diacylglycerol O-acyltransferase 2-like isoform X1 n=1 Tax=Episyrphus balteatus TaxID=286459 RepID=UPI002486B710|nr:diacylglycerol O-acyltransferase 2-like isoform X1 [Episyrphus balteatus]
MLKVEWAPINVPLERRIQTFTTAVYIFLAYGVCLASHCYYIFLLIFGNYYLKALLIAYGIWIYFDKEKSENEVRGSGWRWMRDNFFWKHFRDYFPVELVKTEELPPNRNYLLACYPHGVAGIGIFTNMGVDISKWDELFPKVRPKAGTLAFQFSTPFWRHIVKLWGLISVTRKSLLNNLTTSHDPNDPLNAADGYTASAVAVVVGGAREALDSKPGKYIITIKERKGFVKLAMQAGAAIVPVFSFGEVDVFDQLDNPPNSFVRNMQLMVKKVTGIAPLIILGRGFFQYNIGMLPQRRRIVQVVGAPIDVPKSDNPKKEDVEKYHQKFMDDLNALFETHKAKYIPESEKIFLVMK